MRIVGGLASSWQGTRRARRERHIRRGRPHPHQARRRHPHRGPDRLADRRLHARGCARGADGRHGHGDLLPGALRARARQVDPGHDPLGRADGLRIAVTPHGRQALHGWSGRQDHASPGADRRRVRRGRTAAVRTRARSHRWHSRQARVHPRVARPPHQRRDAVDARRRRGSDLCCRFRSGACRPQALRPA